MYKRQVPNVRYGYSELDVPSTLTTHFLLRNLYTTTVADGATEAVSYTHLDVYKRQALRLELLVVADISGSQSTDHDKA